LKSSAIYQVSIGTVRGSVGVAEDGFVAAVLERVRLARARLAAARASGDPYEAAVAADELDDAGRVADQHGIGTEAVVEPAAGAVTETGAGPVAEPIGEPEEEQR
jgi:hypothetical protein